MSILISGYFCRWFNNGLITIYTNGKRKITMKASSQENTQQWIESWKRASVALKTVKRHELRTYDLTKNQAIVDGMLQWAFENRELRLSSGLVEQQRLFMKMKSS